jgi:hypothetical protein
MPAEEKSLSARTIEPSFSPEEQANNERNGLNKQWQVGLDLSFRKILNRERDQI